MSSWLGCAKPWFTSHCENCQDRGPLLFVSISVDQPICCRAAYGATVDLIASSKLPLPLPLAYAGAVMVELGCGVLMIAGYRARAAAGVLTLFCVATAVLFHTNFTDPDQIFHFIKNVVMTSGLLQFVAFGAGAINIDDRHSHGPSDLRCSRIHQERCTGLGFFRAQRPQCPYP